MRDPERWGEATARAYVEALRVAEPRVQRAAFLLMSIASARLRRRRAHDDSIRRRSARARLGRALKRAVRRIG